MTQKNTQGELVLKSNLSQGEIGRIERGQKNVGLETSYALSIGLGITLKELFNFKY